MTENANTEYFHRANTHCIFCSTEITPNSEVVNRNLAPKELEEDEDERDDAERLQLSVSMAGKILGVEDSVKEKRLSEFGPNIDPESPDFWVRICPSCSDLVEDHIDLKWEISKLERRAKRIQLKLKGFIITSNQEGKDDGVDEGNSVFWKGIREQVLQEPVAGPSNIPKGAQGQNAAGPGNPPQIPLGTRNGKNGSKNEVIVVPNLRGQGQGVKRKANSLNQPSSSLGATQGSSGSSKAPTISAVCEGGNRIVNNPNEVLLSSDNVEVVYRCKKCPYNTTFKREELDAHRDFHRRERHSERRVVVTDQNL